MTRYEIVTGYELVLVLLGLASAAVVAYAAIAWILDRMQGGPAIRRRLRDIAEMPRVERYPGCVTCEAAEGVSYAAMIRHQRSEHAGGVRYAVPLELVK